jgi:hypothetical protein
MCRNGVPRDETSELSVIQRSSIADIAIWILRSTKRFGLAGGFGKQR